MDQSISALEGPVATSIEASCHEAATKAALLVPENVLTEGAAGASLEPGARPAARCPWAEPRRRPPNPNYDFSFPVELAGRPGLQINWNRGDDPNMVAIRALRRRRASRHPARGLCTGFGRPTFAPASATPRAS